MRTPPQIHLVVSAMELKVRVFDMPGAARTNQKQAKYQAKEVNRKMTTQMKKQLYVSNIDYKVTELELKEFFEDYGTVTYCRIVTDKDTGRPRGFGFIQMSTPAEAEAALDVDGMQIGQRNVKVQYARERNETSG